MSKLHVHRWGPEDAPQILLLHGFMGTGEDWAPVARALQDFRVVAPDLPGHGGSTGLPDRLYTLAGAADAVAELVGASGLLGGYSMGGRLARRASLSPGAAHRPRALLQISAHPGIARPEDRRARRGLDAERAVEMRTDWAAFLEKWLAMPLFVSLDAAAKSRIRDRRLRQSPDELARALEGFSTGLQEPGWPPCPVTEVIGERDEKYRGLAGPGAVVIPGAGHNLVAEAPEALAAAVGAWARDRPCVTLPSRTPRIN